MLSRIQFSTWITGRSNPGKTSRTPDHSYFRSLLIRIPVLVWALTALAGFGLYGQTQAEKKDESGNEIFHISKLTRKIPDFSIKRDIFSFEALPPQANSLNNAPLPTKAPEPPPLTEEEMKRIKEANLENEIKQTVVYDGYVIKNSRKNAILTVGGESMVVSVNDRVQGRIKINKIEKKSITVEVDSKEIEIQLKGDKENEQNN